MNFQQLILKLTKVCGCETAEEIDQFQKIKPLNDSFTYDHDTKQWKKIINGIPQEIQQLSEKTAPPPIPTNSNLDNFNIGVEQRNKYIDVLGKDSKQINLFVPKENKSNTNQPPKEEEITLLKND